jgi:HK97 family phage prohead protease
MLRKALSNGVLIKGAGTGRAIFSRYNVVDSDGDVTLPGAFQDGTEVVISAYGHSSWASALPVGKAVIRDQGGWAEAELEFFDTPDGQMHRDTLKALGALGQWSYGFDIAEHSFGDFGGRNVRFLQKLTVHEVSPVLVGAGVRTQTVDIRGAAPAATAAAIADLATIRDQLGQTRLRAIREAVR